MKKEAPERTAFRGVLRLLWRQPSGQGSMVSMPSTTAPDVLLLVDPTLGEYAMLSEAVKVLGKLNENIETMLKKQKKGEKHENT